MMRQGYLHMNYAIRSCDFHRHFRDDIYLAIRMLLWVLQQLRKKDLDTWSHVQPGYYSMWLGSLHLFKADYQPLFGHGRTE